MFDARCKEKDQKTLKGHRVVMTTAVSAKLLSTNGGNDKYKLFSLYTLYNTQFKIKLNRHYTKKYHVLKQNLF